MPVKLFDTTGYKKVTIEEFWKKIDEKDDYYLDIYEYSEADIDGKHVWIPTVEKLMELEDEQMAFDFEAEVP